jgi:hypothetical protein
MLDRLAVFISPEDADNRRSSWRLDIGHSALGAKLVKVATLDRQSCFPPTEQSISLVSFNYQAT